jgi:hypothetical protein
MDVVYIALTLAFWALMVAVAKGCDKLTERRS